MVRTTDGLLFALALLAFANWQAATSFADDGELLALAGVGVAGVVLLLDLAEGE
mgnify:CR=1 FL=1